jgi:peroxiredoxin Q/BCP
MKKQWIVCLVLAAAQFGIGSGGSWAADDAKKVELKVGAKAPEFESVDDQGQPWKSSDHFGKKVVVIYFYPADLTGGCTKQACGFRDDMGKLTEKGVEVVGVSGDGVDNHQLFKKVHKLSFTLLADEKGSVAKAFGVPTKEGGVFPTKDLEGKPISLKRGVTAERWTFVVDKDGKIALAGKVKDAAGDSKRVLEALEKLQK